MKIGSLCAGYGGLEEGVRSVLGGEVAWQSEIDPGACKILAHRYPGVPNIGDMTAVDWSSVEPVDVICGGTPCQDLSHAGKRAGMRAGTRSGLWASMCDAIEIIRPGLVVWENVRGALSAGADSAVEPCPICVGDERDTHLRALGRVVGDLAELGYVGRWTGLRAADVGAPHGRFRVFVVAWPAADAERDRRQRGSEAPSSGWADGSGSRAAVAGRGADAASDTDDLGHASEGAGRSGPQVAAVAGDRGATAHSEGDRRHEGRAEPARVVGGPDAALSGDATADTDCGGLRLEPVAEFGSCSPSLTGHAGVEWGAYADAVRRWERRLGRPAPSPTEPGSKGQPRLSPAFVEWMMGLPAGWVTDVPGLGRNEQLKALGNGVVWQQAAEALRLLLPDVAVAA